MTSKTVANALPAALKPLALTIEAGELDQSRFPQLNAPGLHLLVADSHLPVAGVGEHRHFRGLGNLLAFVQQHPIGIHGGLDLCPIDGRHLRVSGSVIHPDHISHPRVNAVFSDNCQALRFASRG